MRSWAWLRRRAIRCSVSGSLAHVPPSGSRRWAGPCLHRWMSRTRSIAKRRTWRDAWAAHRRAARGREPCAASATASSASAPAALLPARHVPRSATVAVLAQAPAGASATTSASVQALRRARVASALAPACLRIVARVAAQSVPAGSAPRAIARRHAARLVSDESRSRLPACEIASWQRRSRTRAGAEASAATSTIAAVTARRPRIMAGLDTAVRERMTSFANLGRRSELDSEDLHGRLDPAQRQRPAGTKPHTVGIAQHVPRAGGHQDRPAEIARLHLQARRLIHRVAHDRVDDALVRADVAG